jgi:hypothetical protein
VYWVQFSASYRWQDFRHSNRSGRKACKVWQVAIFQLSPAGESFTVVTDELGHFEAGGREPGSYLVGEGVLAQTITSEWPLRVYYPGATSREQAKTIELGSGEWRTDIDFSLPPTSTAP